MEHAIPDANNPELSFRTSTGPRPKIVKVGFPALISGWHCAFQTVPFLEPLKCCKRHLSLEMSFLPWGVLVPHGCQRSLLQNAACSIHRLHVEFILQVFRNRNTKHRALTSQIEILPTCNFRNAMIFLQTKKHRQAEGPQLSRTHISPNVTGGQRFGIPGF